VGAQALVPLSGAPRFNNLFAKTYTYLSKPPTSNVYMCMYMYAYKTFQECQDIMLRQLCTGRRCIPTEVHVHYFNDDVSGRCLMFARRE
jgi:hypothetical protein